MEGTIERIHAEVRSMYEAYPYPDYPLFVKLRWQEAYQGTANFSASLARSPSLVYNPHPRILIAGCGDTQPYILRKIEPSQFHIDAVDISKKSIIRAKTRLLWDPKSINFFHQDLDNFLQEPGEGYDHIDCYGVLHHLANPTKSLSLLHQSLKPGGTLRLMVYNHIARNWIYHIKRALFLLGFDPGNLSHVKSAQEFLRSVGYWIPNIKDKLQDMGTRTISSPSRFVDAFFHAREARVNIADWFSSASRCGFSITGLFDRYAELDDLPNPLWSPPRIVDLQARIDDKRFENNLELYLQKNSNISLLRNSEIKNRKTIHLSLRTAPVSWFQFEETRSIPFAIRQRLWWSHIKSVYHNKNDSIDLLLAELSTEARQRLARIGAIFPKQVKRGHYRDQMLGPIWNQMEIPQASPQTSVSDTPLPHVIRSILIRNKQRLDVESLVIERLNRAQT